MRVLLIRFRYSMNRLRSGFRSAVAFSARRRRRSGMGFSRAQVPLMGATPT